MNFAISRRTDEHFVSGKKYECTNVYNGFIDVLDEHRELIKVDLADSDFLFVLNTEENHGKITNADKIRQMSDEELAEFLVMSFTYQNGYRVDTIFRGHDSPDCETREEAEILQLQWLKMEAN